MANTQWLSLLNYSAKYGVSLSTLRRRIKSHTIKYRLENGKYFLIDDGGVIEESKIEITPPTQNMANMFQSPNYVEASVLSSANRLIEELKAAYAKILQEKEEQISLLKDEVVDLRMLVKLLEEKQIPSQSVSQKDTFSFSTPDFLLSDLDFKE